MRTTTKILLAGALLFGAAACSDSKSTSTTTAAPTTEVVTPATDGGTPAPAGDATVVLNDSSLGQILTTQSGMTVYLFTPDSATSSACTGGCASAWPPVAGPAVGGEGLDASLFGTLTRDDGSTQATYNGHPLYLYAGDTQPGDTAGQGSGGSWFAITAAGEQAGQ